MFVKVSLILLISIVVAANLSDEEEWKNFKATYKKSYETPEEEARRYEIFKNNLKQIAEHNKKFTTGQVSYTQGVNQFTDITQDEFRQQHLGLHHQ